MALAALGANAQSCVIGNTTIARGESGFITYTFSDVDFSNSDLFIMQIKPVEGLTLGNFADVQLSESIFESSNVAADLSDYKINTNGTIVYCVGLESGTFSAEAANLVVKIPVTVSEDAELGDVDLLPSKFIIGDDYELDVDDEDEVKPGVLTITSAAATLDATVYAAAGVQNKTFADAADVQDFVDANPNAIVVFASASNEIKAIPNVVVGDKASSIILSNAAAYTYTGTAFTAKSVEFTYNFTTKASKAGGWNSLAIPFTGTPEVDPFTSADKVNGKFWAKQFTGSTSEGLVFADLASATFEVNKSYIVAFPGASYGANEFANDYLKISATNAEVSPATSVKVDGDPFAMKTIYAGQAPVGAYVLDAAANKFVKQDAAAAVAPFQAYAIAASSAAPALRSLAILDANNGITSVESVEAAAGVVVYANEGEIVINANESGVASVYNMNGQVVKANVKYNEGETRIAGLAAGAYVVAGQVVVLK